MLLLFKIIIILFDVKMCKKKELKSSLIFVVPTIGLEPMTYALRVRCTTNCAKSAKLLILKT